MLGLHGMLGVLSYHGMWQNLVWIVFYVEGCGASSAEYRVHLVSVSSFLLCIVGKMAQDVGMV